VASPAVFAETVMDEGVDPELADMLSQPAFEEAVQLRAPPPPVLEIKSV
jgi:hypothetical protein